MKNQKIKIKTEVKKISSFFGGLILVPLLACVISMMSGGFISAAVGYDIPQVVLIEMVVILSFVIAICIYHIDTETEIIEGELVK